MTGRVTFVVATYKRTDALRSTLQSLMLQDDPDWMGLVIGDACGPETCDVIRGLAEPRLRYYNLPRRCGEQSGPNTFGLQLAQSEHVAFLNHDDLLLPDHVRVSRGVISSAGADVSFGRFANVTHLADGPNGTALPVATGLLPRETDLEDLLHPDPYLLDPSSFWLVRTAFAKSVGAWRPAQELRRTPLRDWLLRAWRAGGRFAMGNQLTGVRFWTQNLRSHGPLYSHALPEVEYLLDAIRERGTEAVRHILESQILAAPPDERFVVKRRSWLLRTLTGSLYRSVGLDAFAVGAALRGRSRADVLQRISRKRTGEPLPEPWPLAELLKDAENCRVL